MKKLRTKVQEYHSIEGYFKRFYPESYKKQLLEDCNPNTLGTILARESLKKLKNLMQKQKLCI